MNEYQEKCFKLNFKVEEVRIFCVVLARSSKMDIISYSAMESLVVLYPSRSPLQSIVFVCHLFLETRPCPVTYSTSTCSHRTVVLVVSS